MAQARPHPPVLLVVAAFSGHPEAIAWARQCLENKFGPIALASEPYLFNQTAYYETSMGRNLSKQFFALRDLAPADRLAEVKTQTNQIEQELAATRQYPEPRPLNLDPGHLMLGKFVLATTKDQAHRIYLGDGIFAEVTLHYQAGGYEPWPWTYADYRQECVRGFMHQAREYYRQRLREA